MLTTEQAALLQAAVVADPTLSLLTPSADNAFAIADAFNLPSSPEFIVWRTSVSQDEIMQNGFDWTRVDNLANGKARIWEWMFDNQASVFDPSKANVRDGINAVWVGTAADLAVRAAVYVHCKRLANRVEKLLSTGDGTDAIPATMVYEGTLNYQDVLTAMGW